ncbi:MAG TPA: T9SS type A sorting domain-containing protein, partial [Candidatus Kapabacteria bacterium]|nr:T9SS type A sorting domain-containing protein [Candidatus Kapabacteria bacterium]
CCRTVLGLLMLAVFSLAAYAGEPLKPLPSIGLTRVNVAPPPYQNLGYYPNGKILVAEAQPGGQRYLLVPVTITNCWDSVPIYSFQFALDYDPLVLKAVGVQKTGPAPYYSVGLANNFQITFNDATNPTPDTDVASLTRRITISGSSSIPLALTTPPNSSDCRLVDTLDFLYVRFQVLKSSSSVPSSSILSIPNDTNSLFWNDYTPRTLFPNASLNDSHYGLIGPDSIDYTGSVAYGGAGGLKTGRGRANLVITKLPGLDLSFTDIDVTKIDGYNYTFSQEMYADSGTTSFIRNRQLYILDSTTETRITNLSLTSNEPWLKISSDSLTLGNTNYTVNLLDYTGDPLLRQQAVYIVIDMSYFQNNTSLTAGIYRGVITFTSDQTGNTPTKLYVTFIYLRNPIEPSGNPNNTAPNTGMHLLVQNSASNPQTSLLTFGTGVGATDGPDSLFGETELANTPNSSSFSAYWYPPSLGPTFNGMSDFSDIHFSGNYNSVSRDIRGWKVDTTIIYHCIYNLGNVSNYPIVLQWDTTEFPPGSRLILRDTLNGSRFAVDMRQATAGGGAIQTYTIHDRDLNSFDIEYTPGSVATTPGIVKGWNLVSLPVISPDPRVITVYPNALDNHTAFLYFQSSYQQVSSLDFGRGYFVKWGNIITSQDTEVAGIRQFAINPPDVSVSDGWNAIGSMSVPIQTSGLNFAPRGSLPLPSLVNGNVWAYDNNRGYRLVTAIYPGRGYWIDVAGDGYLTMTETAPPIADQGTGAATGKDLASMNTYMNHLTVRDNAQREADVYFGSASSIDLSNYNMPPVPPSPAFDVRFATNRSVENVTNNGSVLRFQTSDYPVVLAFNNAKSNYEVTDLSGHVLGEVAGGQSSEITITNRNIHAVNILAKSTASASLDVPTTEALTQNYPNPFNPTTEFFYSVPTSENVTITVLNALGQEVATLVNGNVEAGTYKIHFDATNLPNGIYYYKMAAGDFTATHKMILMK